MRNFLRLFAVLVFSVGTTARAQRVLVGTPFEFQSASAIGIAGADVVNSLCLQTFTPPTRTITPTDPAARRTAVVLPRIPCPYLPGPRHPLTHGAVSLYLVMFQQLQTRSILDVGTYDVTCTNTAAAFDLRFGDPVDPAYGECGASWIPREIGTTPLLNSTFRIEVFNHPPELNVSHGGTGLISGRDVGARAQLTLTSGARDLDGDTTVSWRAIPPPTGRARATLGTAGTSPTNTIQFTGEEDFGTWTFVVTVDDRQGERVTQNYNINVVNQTPRPVISLRGGGNRVLVGRELTLDLTPDDDGGDYAAVQWEALPPRGSWGPIGMGGAARTFTMPTSRSSLGVWSFRARVTDNEMPALAGTSEPFDVDVYNEPPVVTATAGTSRIGVGQPFPLFAEAHDPDGPPGPLTVRWIVIQAPNAAPVALGTPLPALPAASHPGTWAFRAQAEDDEGETTKSAPVAMLVDADPIAGIEGGPTITVRAPFDVHDLSWDPDSDCPPSVMESDPHGCHSVAPGETFTPLSPGLTHWTWYLDSVPAGYELFHPPGRIGETFPSVHSGYSQVLHVDEGQMPFGTYLLRVEVADNEGTRRSATVQLRVLAPEVPPTAHINMPQRYLLGASHQLLTDVVLDGRNSADLGHALSDLTAPWPGAGIGGYQWLVTPPSGCSMPPAAGSASVLPLFTAGTVIGDGCVGVWNVMLQVVDVDTPQMSDLRTQDFVIGRCAGEVCIDRPTHERPQLVDTAAPVDVPIYYYVEPSVFARYPGGFYGVIDIIPAGGSTPVYTLYDSSISTRTPGSLNVVHWHGEAAVGGLAPSGTYDLRVRIADTSGIRFDPSQDHAELAILFEDVDATIAATSTRYSRHEDLATGLHRPGFDWSITGAISVDGVRMKITRSGAGVAMEETTATSRLSGRFSWNGQTSTGTLLPPGDYEVRIMALRGTRILATSAPWRFTVYRLRLGPTTPGPLSVGVNDDDDNLSGVPDRNELNVTGELDLAAVAVSIEPASLAGTFAVSPADGGTGVAVFLGATKTAPAPASVTTPGPIPAHFVEGRTPGRHQLELAFTPPTGPPLTVRREVVVVGIEFLSAAGSPATSVVAGLWENGHSQTGPVVDARGGGPFAVNNSASSHFVDVDPARFVVRVTDANANRDPATIESIIAEVGTLVAWPLDAMGERWADARTPVALRETGPDTGVFVSEAQLLTNNDEPPGTSAHALDDALAAFSPRAGAPVADEVPNDRTHRLSPLGSSTPDAGFIGGGVRATYLGTISTTSPVCGREPDQRRSIDLRVTALLEPYEDTNHNGRFDMVESNGIPGHQREEVSEPYLDLSTNKMTFIAGGPASVAAGCDGRGPAVSDAYVDFRIRRSNMAWAPACIEFRRVGPVRVLDDDRLTGEFGLIRNGLVSGDLGVREVIFDILDTSVIGPLARDSIAVVFGFTRCSGCYAYTDSSNWATFTDGRVLIMHPSGELDDSLRNLPHELGHAITNTDDLPNPNWQFFPAAFTDTDEDFQQHRITSDAGVDARTTRDPADPNSRGNTFLHPY
jgi:hypothetical protein